MAEQSASDAGESAQIAILPMIMLKTAKVIAHRPNDLRVGPDVLDDLATADAVAKFHDRTLATATAGQDLCPPPEVVWDANLGH